MLWGPLSKAIQLDEENPELSAFSIATALLKEKFGVDVIRNSCSEKNAQSYECRIQIADSKGTQ
jgi:hypothetical protein